MPKPNDKNKWVSVRLENSLHKKLTIDADKAGRSISRHVRELIKQSVGKHEPT